MHLMNSFSSLVAATATTAKPTSSGSSSDFFLVIIVLFVLAYFLLLRPNRKRQMSAMRARTAYDLGDEVVAGGMVGRVVRMGDGEVDIEVSDGVIVQFVPQAVQLRSAYNAGPANRGGAGRGMGGGGGLFGGGASSGSGSSGSSSSGARSSTSASSVDNGSVDNGSATSTVARSRSVRRRGIASGTWPEASDSLPAGEGSDVTDVTDSGGGSGSGLSDGGVAPSSGDN
jgi:preprotein translocase subunit YajC